MLKYVVTVKLDAVKAVLTVGPFRTAKEAKAWTEEFVDADPAVAAVAVTRSLWAPRDAATFLRSQAVKAS